MSHNLNARVGRPVKLRQNVPILPLSVQQFEGLDYPLVQWLQHRCCFWGKKFNFDVAEILWLVRWGVVHEKDNVAVLSLHFFIEGLKET